MTVASTSNRKTFTGDDATTSFATSPVEFFQTSDLEVRVVVIATGAETLLVENTNYTVTGGSGTTGTVNLAGGSSPHGALLSTTKLVILRVLPFTQTVDFVDNDGSDADVGEVALDRSIMLLQQVKEVLDRSIRLPEGDISGSGTEVPAAASRASMLLSFDSDGKLSVTTPTVALAAFAFSQSLLPTADNTYDMGSIAFSIRSGYFDTDIKTKQITGLFSFPLKLDGGADHTEVRENGTLVWSQGLVLTPGTDIANQIGLSNKRLLNVFTQVVDSGSGTLVLKGAGTTALTLTGSTATFAGKVVSPAFAHQVSGLAYSNGTDAVNDINISTGAAFDSAGVSMVLASALGKQSDVAWAVGGTTGTPLGGLDTGAVGNNDYYIWLIARSDTGVVDALFSLSSTAPTMPTNYDTKKLIGWFKRVGGTVVAFHTYETEGGGLEMNWDVPTLDINLANTLTTSRRTDAMKVPLNFSVLAHINATINDAGAASAFAWLCCPDQTDAAPSLTAAPLANIQQDAANGSAQAQLFIRTSAAGLIAARANIATVDLYAVSTMGFTWTRRN